ncbi:phosphatidylserine decarboxylase [Herpetosiphon gulosus]|uniref:Phosphatidylserine decarboxylase proenzyme n=1 Tax=Herpetosiphon gulosus TaxID=1973496 RepID=A0ABP9WTB0_9CHLR
MPSNRARVRRSLPGIAIEGMPFIGAGLGLTALTALFSRKAAILPLALTAFTSYFFRDPDRECPADSSILYAAADGHITMIDEVDEPRFIGGKATRIVTFLSVFDVHINRTPCAGTVQYRDYVQGEFRAAWDGEADIVNERAYLGLETEHGPVLISQIAGLVARRIITWPVVGEELGAGERFGLIKFGSRTDILVPSGSINIFVKKGQAIKGGLTQIGAWL